MSRGRRAPESGRLVPPEPSVVDLHVHTCRSDGLLAPTDLVEAAAAAPPPGYYGDHLGDLLHQPGQ